jgi:hypothetical protein
MYDSLILAKIINNILRKFKFWKKVVLIIINNTVGLLLQSTGTSITILRYVCGIGLWMSDSSKNSLKQ